MRLYILQADHCDTHRCLTEAVADGPREKSAPFVHFESHSHACVDCRPVLARAPQEIPPLYPCRSLPGHPFVVPLPALARILGAAQSQGYKYVFLYTPPLVEGPRGVHTFLKSHDDAEEPAVHHEQDWKGILLARVVGCEENAGAHCWEDRLWKKMMTEEVRVGRRVEKKVERLPASGRQKHTLV